MAKETIDLVVKIGDDTTSTIKASISKNFVQRMEAKKDEEGNVIKDADGNNEKVPTLIFDDNIQITQGEYFKVMKDGGITREDLTQVDNIEDSIRNAAENVLVDRARGFLEKKENKGKDTHSRYSVRRCRGNMSGEIISRQTKGEEVKKSVLKRKVKLPASGIKTARDILAEKFGTVLD